MLYDDFNDKKTKGEISIPSPKLLIFSGKKNNENEWVKHLKIKILPLKN